MPRENTVPDGVLFIASGTVFLGRTARSRRDRRERTETSPRDHRASMRMTSRGGPVPVSKTRIAYRLCPKCFRAVPAASQEAFCANDGARLLEVCPKCASPITSPYARYCVACGLEFGGSTPAPSGQAQDRIHNLSTEIKGEPR
jgi:hypothetical protein